MPLFLTNAQSRNVTVSPQFEEVDPHLALARLPNNTGKQEK
jgi:hypothetical protein